jgi:hypothetical protein
VSAAPAQVLTSDPVLDALKAQWHPGTPLTRQLANKIAKATHVSPSAVYKARKKLSAAEVAPPPAPPLAPERVQPAASSGPQLQIEPILKPKEAGTAGGAPLSLTPALGVWTKEEIAPIFEGVNQLMAGAEVAKIEALPKSESINQLADLWAQVFNAFKVPKGEAGGKYVIVLSAGVGTFGAYWPVIAKVIAPKPKTPPPSEGEKPSD